MIINQKHSSNRTDIFKSARNFYEKLKTKKTTSKATTTEFLSKILIRNKTSNEQFHHCEAKLSLDEAAKSINSQTNNKSPGNDGLKAEFYKHFQMS